jgi:hypothetical protein
VEIRHFNVGVDPMRAYSGSVPASACRDPLRVAIHLFHVEVPLPKFILIGRPPQRNEAQGAWAQQLLRRVL